MDIVTFLLSTFLILMPVSSDGIATWYGDEFIGKHHDAHWHEKTPLDAPEVVTNDFPGVAAPSHIPFGTKLLLVRESTCMGHGSSYDGTFVIATIVDRKANCKLSHYYDLWPATAKVLGFGPTFENDAGCIQVQAYTIGGLE